MHYYGEVSFCAKKDLRIAHFMLDFHRCRAGDGRAGSVWYAVHAEHDGGRMR